MKATKSKKSIFNLKGSCILVLTTIMASTFLSALVSTYILGIDVAKSSSTLSTTPKQSNIHGDNTEATTVSTGTVTTPTLASCDNPFQIWPILNVEKEEIFGIREEAAPTEELEGDVNSSPIERKEEQRVLAPASCPKMFRPVDFFRNESSPGYKYLKHLEHLSASPYISRLMGINLDHVKFTKATTPSTNGNSEEEEEGEWGVDEFHLLYNSVPKSASTTMRNAFKSLNEMLESTNHLNGKHHMMMYSGDRKDFDQTNSMLERMEKEWNATIGTISKASMNMPPSSLQQKFRYFGIMREPVGRFVSATAQEMTWKTARGRAIEFREDCLKDNAKDTLKCAIGSVREWFKIKDLRRIHYVPSAVLFNIRILGFDVPMEVIEFGNLKGVLDNFLTDDMHSNKQEEKESGDIVTSMSVSDLSEDMIEEICELYAIDVLIMRHLNMEDKYCKGHVSFGTNFWGQ